MKALMIQLPLSDSSHLFSGL